MNNQNKETQHKEDTLRVLNSLRVEVQSLWGLYTQKIGPHVENTPESEPLLIVWPLTQNYFVFYEANAITIGSIENQVLMEKIVDTYALMKSMVDSYRMNNHLLNVYEESLKQYHRSKSQEDKAICDSNMGILRQYAEALKESHYLCTQKVSDLLSELKSISDTEKGTPKLTVLQSERIQNGID